MAVSRLRVGNEAFLVASMIERCPKAMMLRELVMNAIEAATGEAATGEARVDIFPLEIEGARKLAILNTGRGMSAGEMRRMCDIASSIGKPNALDGNFGMGAKVASLPSNRHGLRYRSCRAGLVHQVVMGKRDGAYGRLGQRDADGALVDVIEVTDAARAMRPLDQDWTEVVLLGNHPAQDTVRDPYDAAPASSANWIAEGLYARFFRLPPRVTIWLHEGCHTRQGVREFVPLARRHAAFTRAESVPAEGGIVVHYLHDAPAPEGGALASSVGALQGAGGAVALVHRGEIHDLRCGGTWINEAPIFGMPFGARCVSVYVELPDDHPVLPDAYRQFLRHAGQLQRAVEVREFAALVLRHRPEWLQQLLRDLAPRPRHGAVLCDEMTGMFRDLGVRRRWWPPAPHIARAARAEPATPDRVEYEVAPQIVPLVDPADIRERGLADRAARFYAETHQLFVNTQYAAFTELAELLRREHAAHPAQEEIRAAAAGIAELLLTRQICRRLVFALARRADWPAWELEQVLSPAALTLAADDHLDRLDEARRLMNQQLAADMPAPIRAARPGLAQALRSRRLANV